PSSDVGVKARRGKECRRERSNAQHRIATKGRPGTGFVGSLWSALQTHLQGVDRAMLAIMPEKCRHRTALLSRLSCAKIACPAKEGKLQSSPAGEFVAAVGLDQAVV